MKALLKNRKGVTLVELLAVLVILGIIAAIAIPTIGNLIDNSRQRAAEAEWSNIQEAARLYATSEEPAAAFSLDDFNSEAATFDVEYISFDGTFTSDSEGATSISDSDLFDADSGDLIDDTTVIYIDGYLVNGTPA